jgi:hypothetical protein
MSRSFLSRMSTYIPLSAAGWRRAARPKARGYRPELVVLEDRWLPSTILWNGGGHDGLWRTAANWAGGAVPGPADDAVIDDTSPPVTVTLAGGGSPVSVRSLTCTRGFVLTGSLTVSAGPSSVSGAFTLNITGDLRVQGTTASLTATGTTTVLGANLSARSGGRLSLLGATTVDATRVLGNSFEPFTADGADSRLDLSGVTTWLGGGNAVQGSAIVVQAANGGTVDLPHVTDISVGNTIFGAASGGQINLTGLTRFAGAAAPLVNFLSATGGGAAIVAPALTSLTNVDLQLRGSASLSLGRLSSFARGNITVQGDGVTGGVLALPLTTIDQSGDTLFGETFKADGAGSRLDLSGVTTWRGAGPAAIGRRIAVQATNGGTVDLSHVASISAGNSSFQALDGGQLNLTSLTSFAAPAGAGGINTLEAHRRGAAVVAPALTSLTNVDLILAGTASLPVAGLSTFQHGNILVGQEFGDVGGVLALPWTTIDQSGFTGSSPTFRADGPGSRLDLSSVTTWRGAGSAADDTRLNVLASNGGTVDLSQVPSIAAGNTSFQAVNPSSQINLAGLTSFTGAIAGPSSNVLDARQGGTLTLNSGTTVVSNVLVRVDPTGTLTAGTLQLSGGSLLTGSGTLPANLSNDALVQPNTATDALVITGDYAQTGAVTGQGTLSVNGLLTWTGGTLGGRGTVNANGGLALSGAADKTLDGRTLNLAGTSTWSDAGNLVLANNALLTNRATGVFTIQNDQTLSGGGSFNNLGTLAKSSGAAGTTTIGVAFSNTGGTVDVQSGALSVAGDYTQSGGATVVRAGATLAAGGLVNLLGGTLSGSGTVNGDVRNAGQVAPGTDGTAGALTINGNYTQTAAGVLTIAIGGRTAGAEYDQLVVSGSVSLDGTLTVNLVNGFVPQSGDGFQVLTFGSGSGVFAALNGDGPLFTPRYDPNDVTLVAN